MEALDFGVGVFHEVEFGDVEAVSEDVDGSDGDAWGCGDALEHKFFVFEGMFQGRGCFIHPVEGVRGREMRLGWS